MEVNTLITNCELTNFKNYAYKKIELAHFSLIVGQNNSGKSTILHAILLAHEIIKQALHKKNKLELVNTTLTFDDLKIIPLSNVDAIWKDNKFTQSNEAKIKLYFGEEYIECALRKGKNGNVAVRFEISENLKPEILESFANSKNPSTLLVPGLAGILSKESYVGRYARTRSITVGDANLVLRNIVVSLGLNQEKNEEFNELVDKIKFIFPNITNLRVNYNEDTDEYLSVEVEKNNEGIYFDIVTTGTGFLQTLQILSYIFEYNPKILLLDEPDSHLHADNQLKLLQTLKELSEEREFQVIISSHSREFLQNTAPNSIIWLNSNQEVQIDGTDATMVQAYIDLGGLDKLDKLRINPKSKNLLSEDEDLTLWKCILREKYGEEFESKVLINTFKGKSNKVGLFLASDFYKKHFPNSKVAFVIDQDFDTEEYLEEYCNEAKKYHLSPFVLNVHEIENLLIIPRVLKVALESLDIELLEEEIIEILKNILDETESVHIDKQMDKLSQLNPKWTPSKCVDESKKILEAKKQNIEEYLDWARGKPILKKVRHFIKTKYGISLTDSILAKALVETKVEDIERIFEWIES
jgi:AAA15 family ATPase/GTPase